MLDKSHNVTDPIESLIGSAIEVTRAYAQALIVDRGALAELQEANDAYLAAQTLKRAFTTDVSPILAEARRRNGGAVDPVATYRGLRVSRPQSQRAPGHGRWRRRVRVSGESVDLFVLLMRRRNVVARLPFLEQFCLLICLRPAGGARKPDRGLQLKIGVSVSLLDLLPRT